MLQQFNPANADLIVNINGELVHRDAAGVSPFDSSVQNGDAVWEGLRLYGGRIFKLHEHLDRLRGSAQLLEYQGYPGDEKLIDELTRTLACLADRESGQGGARSQSAAGGVEEGSSIHMQELRYSEKTAAAIGNKRSPGA